MPSHIVMSVGAVCFGVVVGYVTYRTLARSTHSSVSDLAAVVAVVGGGTVTTVFDPKNSDPFGWYAIGLLAGVTFYGLLYALIGGRKAFLVVMGDRDESLRPPPSR
jgi:hypothetical protein